jgi:hypothetical protein
MFRATMITVAALMGLAVSAPAQLHVEAQLGRHVRATADVGGVRFDGRGRVEPRGREYRPFADHRAPVRFERPTGYWRTITEEVWVPGYFRQEYVPATYGWIVDSCGRRSYEVIAPACTREIWVPGRFECRTRQVFVRC